MKLRKHLLAIASIFIFWTNALAQWNPLPLISTSPLKYSVSDNGTIFIGRNNVLSASSGTQITVQRSWNDISTTESFMFNPATGPSSYYIGKMECVNDTAIVCGMSNGAPKVGYYYKNINGLSYLYADQNNFSATINRIYHLTSPHGKTSYT